MARFLRARIGLRRELPGACRRTSEHEVLLTYPSTPNDVA
jgi:hypothetical protein